MPDAVCLGEALIDFIALESEVSLGEVSGFKKAPGGAPANVAAGLSKLGYSSAFVGKVGDDEFGRFLERTFAGHGVDTSRMLFDPEHRTGLAFISLTAEGVPDFMFYRNPSADMMLEPADLDEAFIKSARVFHYGSITLISEPSKSATLEAIRFAKEGGLLVSYDPNLRPPLWPSLEFAREQMLAAMVYPHIVKVSEEELEFLTGVSDLSDGSEMLMKAYPNIGLAAVTRGAEGSYYRTALAEGSLDAFDVDVVETTGAGDGFTAGMLCGLLESETEPDGIGELSEQDLRRMFRFANGVAALTTTRRGAISALPDRSEVEELLADEISSAD